MKEGWVAGEKNHSKDGPPLPDVTERRLKPPTGVDVRRGASQLRKDASG